MKPILTTTASPLIRPSIDLNIRKRVLIIRDSVDGSHIITSNNMLIDDQRHERKTWISHNGEGIEQ